MRATIWAMGMIAFGLTAGLTACTTPAEDGRADFRAFCASCHGDDGRGHGGAEPELDAAPADLTLIAARNGGSFPRRATMAKIYGDGDTNPHGAVMPQFGPLMDGALIPYDSGDGIKTPTPVRLVAIAEYLEQIQRPAR